jgi:hypothetical protein
MATRKAGVMFAGYADKFPDAGDRRQVGYYRPHLAVEKLSLGVRYIEVGISLGCHYVRGR